MLFQEPLSGIVMVESLFPSKLRRGGVVTVCKGAVYCLGRCLPLPSRPAPSAPQFDCLLWHSLALFVKDVENILPNSEIFLAHCEPLSLYQSVSGWQALLSICLLGKSNWNSHRLRHLLYKYSHSGQHPCPHNPYSLVHTLTILDNPT